jgi:hypothetical protein
MYFLNLFFCKILCFGQLFLQLNILIFDLPFFFLILNYACPGLNVLSLIFAGSFRGIPNEQVSSFSGLFHNSKQLISSIWKMNVNEK